MGVDFLLGEKRELFVAGGVWKMSQIPKADLKTAETEVNGKEKVGCLISEVVTPGFVWEDHEWLTIDGLKKLFEGVENGDAQVEFYSKYIRPD